MKNLKKLPKRQAGIGFISLVLLLVVIGFFTLLILKIGPIYLEHMDVQKILKSIKDDRDVLQWSQGQIRETIIKRLRINYIESITRKNIDIVKQRNYMKTEIIYDVRENIYGNLDVCIHFDEVVEAYSD